jgi:hypothetical protein
LLTSAANLFGDTRSAVLSSCANSDAQFLDQPAQVIEPLRAGLLLYGPHRCRARGAQLE